MRLVFFSLVVEGSNGEGCGDSGAIINRDGGGSRSKEIAPKTSDLRVSICMMKMKVINGGRVGTRVSSTLASDP